MKILQPCALGVLQPRNRLVVAAMSRMQALDNGEVSADMPAYYARYAAQGAGLVITEALYTDEDGARAYHRQPGLVTDLQARGWSRIAGEVHRAGGLLVAQLQHGGRLAEPGLNRLHLAASDGVATGNTWQTGIPNAPARAATPVEIDRIVHGFAQAARRARDAGFDGVELHGARGYLLDNFLSASTNRRDDAYGGSLEGRLALPLRVVREVRRAVGCFPIFYNFSLYKMDDSSYQPPGGPAEAGEIARALHAAGVDVIHVTTRKLLRAEPWGEPLAATIKRAVPHALVVGNGGLKTLDECEQAMAQTGCDAISLARPFLANPDWIGRNLAGGELRAYAPGQERLGLLVQEGG